MPVASDRIEQAQRRPKHHTSHNEHTDFITYNLHTKVNEVFKSVWRQPRVEMLLDERLLGPCGCSDGRSHSSNVPSPRLSILGSHRELLRLPRRYEMSAQHTTAGSQCPPLPKDGVHHLRTMLVAGGIPLS